MQYRVDPKTGNKLSALGFGCMRFPKGMAAAEAVIKSAVEHGVNYFDTAYIYGGSEETLGTVLAKNDLRKDVYITTKLPLLLCRSAADFDRLFEKQLSRLKTDYIDYYLMHMITDLQQWKKLCSWGIEDWIARKKAEGQIRQVGFSFHGSCDEFLDVLAAYDWDICMIQYNYSNENYQAGVTGLRAAASRGIPVIIMEPLLGGKLVNGLPQKAVNLFNKADSSLSPAAWGLRWLWNQPEITGIISGMNAIAQVEENARVAELALPESLSEGEMEVYRQVREVFNAYYKIPCTGCGYCMPCPRHVNIPACFSSYNAMFMLGKITALQQYTTSTGGTSEVQSYASLCTQCGKCEKHCPQNIAIRDSLREVSRKMEPFWYKLAISIARRFLNRGSKYER